MATVSLNKIKFNWRGEWSSTASYQVNDAVSYKGASFVCTVDTPLATRIVRQDPNNLELRVVDTLDTVSVNSFGQPVGQTAAKRRLAPLLPDGLDPQTFAVTYNGSAYVFSGVSGTNPTLKLTAGETYRFDCSALPTTASFALRTAAGVTTNNPIGALFNKPVEGVDSTTTGPQGTPYSTTITYSVPTSPSMTSIVYQSADSSGAVGTIEIVHPADMTAVNSDYWKKLSGFGDEQVLTHQGDIFVEGDANAPHNLPPTQPSYILEGGSAWPSGTVFQVVSPTTGASGPYTIIARTSKTGRSGTISGNNPTLRLAKGNTYYFDVRQVISAHPLALRTSSGSTSALTGTTNNDASAGIHQSTTAGTMITYTIPSDAPDTLVYQCVVHSGMVGTIQTTGSDTDLVYRQQAGRPYATISASNWTASGEISPTGNARPTQVEQTFCVTDINMRGTTSGFKAAQHWILPGRKGLKASGYQATSPLGFNHMSDEYSTTTYPGARFAQPQYCQMDQWLEADEYISYVNGNNGAAFFVTTKGNVYFTGYNGYGQFGFGDTQRRSVFTKQKHFGPGTGRTARDVQMNGSFTSSDGNTNTILVQTVEGELWGAGYNAHGVLGQGDTTNRPFFVRIGAATFNAGGATLLGFKYSRQSGQDGNVIAWDSLKRVWGWGQNGTFTLGIGNQTQQNAPVRLNQLESLYSGTLDVLDVAMNFYSGRCVCAILMSNGIIYTTGQSDQGQLGIGGADSQQSTVWTQITMPAGKTFRRLTNYGAGTGTFYGITTDNFLYAWGYNGYRQIGDATTANRQVATLCSALPDGFQGNIQQLYGEGNGGGYTTVWARATINGRTRWCSWGYNSGGTTMHSDTYVPDRWFTGADPREITQFLPNQGQRIVDIYYQWYGTTTQGWYLLQDDGQMFFVGYTDNYLRDASIGTSNYSAGSGYTFNYPRMVTNSRVFG